MDASEAAEQIRRVIRVELDAKELTKSQLNAKLAEAAANTARLLR